MKKGNMMNKLHINKFLFIIPFLFFIAVFFQMANLSLSTNIDGINLKEFASNRNTHRETLYASRGTIYTYDGAILAQDVNSYTVIAYLSEKRSKNSKKPLHVVDKQKTAESLSPLINMSVEDILKLLNKDNLYQVELGPGGRGITELTKEAIEQLDLPGIDFIQTYKRYYPNNDFLSYTIGYVTTDDKNTMKGEMGIEKYYNDKLNGKNGTLQYQQDLNGYRIPNTPEIKEEAEDGYDIYLTIDDNIQMFTERVVKEGTDKYNPEWMIMTVVDAKTGKILGTASTPSFNPNTKNIESYLNPLVSYTYEPGSTMKIFSYMNAIEKGTYDGTKTYTSGKLTIGDDTISDWNNKGWGVINYDYGFVQSSNTGAATMINNFITANDLKEFYKKLGFGSKTGITLPNEYSGTVKFKYDIEVANATFGQGITITPIQMVQALTTIANKGVMLKPYIVDKIIDPNTGKVVFKSKREEVATIASETTINKIKELMYNVVNCSSYLLCTGSTFKIDGYDIIGKTGTAQYVDSKTGRYMSGENEYIRSFAGMFPAKDPEIIIYAVVKRPSYGASAILSTSVKKLIQDIGKYMDINQVTVEDPALSDTAFVVPNLLNKNIDYVKSLTHSAIIIGDGTKVISQYPASGTTINDDDKLFVITNSKNIILENMKNWSSRDVSNYCGLIGIKCNIDGYGYVDTQSIAAGTNISKIQEVNIVFKRNSKFE